LIKFKEKNLVRIANYGYRHYAQHMLNFSPKIRLCMLLNVMLTKKQQHVMHFRHISAKTQLKNLKQHFD